MFKGKYPSQHELKKGSPQKRPLGPIIRFKKGEHHPPFWESSLFKKNTLTQIKSSTQDRTGTKKKHFRSTFFGCLLEGPPNKNGGLSCWPCWYPQKTNTKPGVPTQEQPQFNTHPKITPGLGVLFLRGPPKMGCCPAPVKRDKKNRGADSKTAILLSPAHLRASSCRRFSLRSSRRWEPRATETARRSSLPRSARKHRSSIRRVSFAFASRVALVGRNGMTQM